MKETTKAKQTTQTPKESSRNSTASEIKHSSTRTKLPKLVLQKFKGDLTRYRTFWETFESAVHKNTELTTVDKLNYLFSLLEGQALRAIKGLAITESNYQAAIDILHERFGKSQQIISGHMDELLKIPPCIGDKASQLRFVYDKLNVNVRGLETLGVKSDQYGSSLIPVIMAKLSSDVRLQVARNAKKDVWEIGELLEIIRKEVEARELYEHVKVDNERKKPPPRSQFPTPSLTAQENYGKRGSVKCVYCGQLHFQRLAKSSSYQMTERKF